MEPLPTELLIPLVFISLYAAFWGIVGILIIILLIKVIRRL
jgi:hypothetical protein